MTDNRDWSVGRVNDEGFELILRLRKRLPDWCDKNSYRHLIAISWPFNGDKGLPQVDDNAQQVEFEELLENRMEEKMIGLLTLVVTGHNSKEWQWYTNDPNLFMQELNSSLPQDKALPIKLSHEEDEKWEAYHKWNSVKN